MSDLAEVIAAAGMDILAANNELNQWPKFNLLYRLYPEEGPLRRELYGKHLKHFAAGARHNERALVGGNRSGKTLACSGSGKRVTRFYPTFDEWKAKFEVVVFDPKITLEIFEEVLESAGLFVGIGQYRPQNLGTRQQALSGIANDDLALRAMGWRRQHRCCVDAQA